MLLCHSRNMSFVWTKSFIDNISSSSNLGTGFTRECIRFRENFAQCRATQQSSTDYLQVKLYTVYIWKKDRQFFSHSFTPKHILAWQILMFTFAIQDWQITWNYFKWVPVPINIILVNFDVEIDESIQCYRCRRVRFL